MAGLQAVTACPPELSPLSLQLMLFCGQKNITSHGVIGTRNKSRPKKRVLKSSNPISYFEVTESKNTA